MAVARPSITTAQAAELLGVSPQTVQKWVDAGHLSAWRTVGGHRRVDAESVHRMLDARNGTVPVVATAASASAATSVPAGAEDGQTNDQTNSRLQIVVIEDDHLASLLLKQRLEQIYPGAAVAVFANGFAALMRISRHVPQLLISDIDLPGLDGLAMLRQLREDPDTQRMAAVLVSGYGREALERFGPIPPNVPLLRKPFEDRELEQVLRQVLPADDQQSLSAAA